MAVLPKQTITLNGSGAATENLEHFVGFLLRVLVNKEGQTNDPAITITEVGSMTQQVLNTTVTSTGDQFYTVRTDTVDSGNTSLSSATPMLIESELQVAITGGDADGDVTIEVQYLPIQG